MSYSAERRTTLVVLFAGGCILAIAWIAVAFAGRPVIEGLMEGRFLRGLGRAMRVHMTNNPEHQSVAYFVDLATAAVGRALLMWVVFGSVLVVVQQKAGDVVTRFTTADGDALTLAITRAVVFAVLAYSVNLSAVERLAGQPEGLIQAPTLMGWFVDLVPISAAVGRWAAVLLIGSAVLASAGAFFRVTGPVAAILAVYVFGIPQLFGKISHAMHGLVWFSMILAVSPAAASVSIDRLLGRAPDPGRSRAFGLPIRMIWFLFACIYFFPGFWKFVISGWDWAFSDNLKFKMYSAWRGSGYLPFFRLDRHPALYQAAAFGSMLWEIAFPLLILFRKTRIAAVLLGAVFHLGVWEFMRIGPPMVMFGYVSFVNWGEAAGRFGYRRWAGVGRGRPWRLTKLGGGLVCGLVFIFGATLIDSWPFGVYPTHAGIRGPTYQTIEVRAFYPSGRSEVVDVQRVAPATGQAVDFAVIGSTDIRRRNAYLTGLARNWKSETDSTGVEIRFYRLVKMLDPDDRAGEPLDRTMLFAVNPDTTMDASRPGS